MKKGTEVYLKCDQQEDGDSAQQITKQQLHQKSGKLTDATTNTSFELSQSVDVNAGEI